MSTKTHLPIRSGFCNPSWSLHTDAGRASHARCHKADCPCPCHAATSIRTVTDEAKIRACVVAALREIVTFARDYTPEADRLVRSSLRYVLDGDPR